MSISHVDWVRDAPAVLDASRFTITTTAFRDVTFDTKTGAVVRVIVESRTRYVTPGPRCGRHHGCDLDVIAMVLPLHEVRAEEHMKKKLELKRDTLINLNADTLDAVNGGTSPAIFTASVRFCRYTPSIVRGIGGAVGVTKHANKPANTDNISGRGECTA